MTSQTTHTRCKRHHTYASEWTPHGNFLHTPLTASEGDRCRLTTWHWSLTLTTFRTTDEHIFYITVFAILQIAFQTDVGKNKFFSLILTQKIFCTIPPLRVMKIGKEEILLGSEIAFGPLLVYSFPWTCFLQAMFEHRLFVFVEEMRSVYFKLFCECSVDGCSMLIIVFRNISVLCPSVARNFGRYGIYMKYLKQWYKMCSWVVRKVVKIKDQY